MRVYVYSAICFRSIPCVCGRWFFLEIEFVLRRSCLFQLCRQVEYYRPPPPANTHTHIERWDNDVYRLFMLCYARYGEKVFALPPTYTHPHALRYHLIMYKAVTEQEYMIVNCCFSRKKKEIYIAVGKVRKIIIYFTENYHILYTNIVVICFILVTVW